MGLINDRRPRDWAYIATFDSKHLPSLQQMIKRVNETHNTDLIEDFNDRCEQHIKGENDPQFESVTKTEDLVVNTGLQQCIDLILLISGTRWQYIGRGIGLTAPSTGNTTLVSESAGGRINMSNLANNGSWREPAGMRLFFGGIDSEQSINADFCEFGIFNASSAGIMLNREVFTSNPINHVSPRLASIFSVVIEFCPVA